VQGEREETRCEGAALQERVTELEDNGEEREREREKAPAASLRKVAGTIWRWGNLELARRLQDSEYVSSSVSVVHE
jgi:hypothetical protein